MAFSESFTGKGTAIKLEDGTTQAFEGLSKMVLDAEKLHYEVYQKNYNEFLKNTDIDPGFLISDSARKYMNERILNYSTKYGKKMQENGGVLPYQDKSDMQTERNLIESERDGLLVDQELWKQHRALIEKDMNVNLSSEDFAKATEEYVRGESKRYNYIINDFLKPLDFGVAYSAELGKLKTKYDTTMRVVGGGKEVPVWKVLKDDIDAAGFMAYMIANNPRARKDYFNRWAKVDQAKYNQMAEENAKIPNIPDWKKNPFLLWGMEEFKDKINPEMQGTPTTIPGAGRGAGKTKVGVGWQRTEDIRYGNTDYSNNYFFKTPIPVDNVPLQQNVSKRHRATVTLPIIKNGSIKGQILEYNPDKDVLIIRATVGNNALGIESQDAIEIPASSLPGVNDIVIEINGQKTTIGNLRNNKPTTPINKPIKTKVTGGEESTKPPSGDWLENL